MFDRHADTPASAGAAGIGGSALLDRHVELLADGQPHLADGDTGVDRVRRAPAAEHREDVVARDALRTHGPELGVEPAPELLQSHATTLTRAPGGGPRLAA